MKDAEARDEELRRFIKKVRDYSDDDELAFEADQLIVLYGDPDATRPKGLINADVTTFNVSHKLDPKDEAAALEQFRELEGQ